MATKKSLTEAQTLEQYRVALENVVNQTQIATVMAEFGYDAACIAQGKAIWQTASDSYMQNKIGDDDTSEAYAVFMSKKDELAAIYNMHRKKARVVFRKDQITLEKLGIKGSLPQSYIKWLEVVKKFYLSSIADTEIQTKLSRLKVTATELTDSNTLISELETARTFYLKGKGESQSATKAKDQTFTDLDDWMSEFYAVAAIAFDDNIQMLESLSFHVKS